MLKNISFWLKNARPISLPQSMMPALTAVALSVGGQEFNLIAALASVFGVMFFCTLDSIFLTTGSIIRSVLLRPGQRLQMRNSEEG